MRVILSAAEEAAWRSKITGPVTLAAPSVEGIGRGAYRFTLPHNGQEHYAVCRAVDVAAEQERLFTECRDDLVSYVAGFVAFGCGWPGHEFNGDVTDRNVYLECVKCGAPKLINQVLEAPSLTGA
jgi:hypothetical protein